MDLFCLIKVTSKDLFARNLLNSKQMSLKILCLQNREVLQKNTLKSFVKQITRLQVVMQRPNRLIQSPQKSNKYAFRHTPKDQIIYVLVDILTRVSLNPKTQHLCSKKRSQKITLADSIQISSLRKWAPQSRSNRQIRQILEDNHLKEPFLIMKRVPNNFVL